MWCRAAVLLGLVGCAGVDGGKHWDEGNCVEECPRLDGCQATGGAYSFFIGTFCDVGDCTDPVDLDGATWSQTNPSCQLDRPCCSVQPNKISAEPEIVCVVYSDLAYSDHDYWGGVPCSDHDMDVCYDLICSPCDQWPAFDQAAVCG